MPISHTHLTKYLSGIVGGKPAALTQSTYPWCQVIDTELEFPAEKEFLKKSKQNFRSALVTSTDQSAVFERFINAVGLADAYKDVWSHNKTQYQHEHV
jgi:hypothetical protein